MFMGMAGFALGLGVMYIGIKVLTMKREIVKLRELAQYRMSLMGNYRKAPHLRIVKDR